MAESNNASEHKALSDKEPGESTTVQYGFRSACSQVTVALAQNFLLIVLGMAYGMPTVVIGVLDHKVVSNQTKQAFPNMILNDEESSWLGSILYLFHPLGAIISGYVVEVVGRKKVMMIVCVPFFLGWVLLYNANSVRMIMISTMTMGVGMGFCEGPIMSYLGEVCEPRIRGSLTLLTGVSGSLGLLAIFFLNALTDWRTTTLLSATIPGLALVMLLFLPESPTWLISKGRLAEAEKSLRWLRGWSTKDKVLVEFEQMVRAVTKAARRSTGTAKVSKMNKLKSAVNYLRQPQILRPFTMLMLLFVITVICSFMPMEPYLVEVFQTFGLPLKAEWVLVLGGVLSITGSLLSSLTVNKFGKRPMSLWSTAICFIFTLMLGFCAMNLHWPGWIPLVVFCTCYWFSGYGVLPLPWMLMSEVFPMDIRSVACGICAALNSIITFLTTKTYINSINWFGLHGTLFMYSSVTGVGLVYMYFYLPETEDRTLEEITDFFLENGNAREFKRPKRLKIKVKSKEMVNLM
ncbi:hypothetical protein M8J77_008456 [Diaphorina citri]|nr:hypothetical protein M8J77_008456 [Diaphorina citri]